MWRALNLRRNATVLNVISGNLGEITLLIIRLVAEESWIFRYSVVCVFSEGVWLV